MISIRRYLTRTLALVLAAITALSITAAYLITKYEMEEILDAQLSLQARLIAAQISADTPLATYREIAAQLSQPGHPARRYTEGRAEPPDAPGEAVRYSHEERMLAVGFWNGDGTPRLLGAKWNDQVPFPPPSAVGYRWIDYGGDRWRVFSLFDTRSETWIRVGIQEEFIDELGGKITLGNLIPMLIALPLLLLATAWIVKRSLRPIDALSREVASRNDRQLSFIEATVPRELGGLQASINAFIARLRETLERERLFTADAAHELRTPLAGIKIHLDNARAGEGASLDKAYTGVARLQRVVEQLLVLARLDRGDAQQAHDIDIYPLVLELVAELWPWAQARGQTLEVTGSTSLRVRADPVEMGILVRNLVDNALRYTPDGGCVTLELASAAGEARLIVRDNGPGVPEAMLARVTERFRRATDQRTTGSGLGLSIVLELAQRQQARLTLANRDPCGLEVTLAWPAAGATRVMTP
ncbi:ATP-binding protein [Modicisalibacter zincidurans]|uniref:histidine kinase n=1 Tax=Modicisalibacter zincidurans TaxID=1178777 RepID=A0ABP9RDJ1_9GAMM|nr:ATP-binding protein [Halomonas zincidurans]